MSVPGATPGSTGRSVAGSGGPDSGFACLERLVADGLVPGASAAVSSPRGPVDERAFGLCDLAEQVPGYALGWAMDGGVFNHFGSSGTHAWGDPERGIAAVCYFQYAGDPNPIEEYQARFWELVRG
ncbi:MAG: hypothetical protein ACOC2D_21720 [Spirochaetota bacterium]